LDDIENDIEDNIDDNSELNKISLLSLQQYKFTKDTISNIIIYLRSNKSKLPDNMNNRQKDRFIETFGSDFTLEEDKLMYGPLKLDVVPPEEKRARLEELFESPEAIGKGNNNFHQLVLRKYLGISRTCITEFLKSKPQYQLFQKKSRAVSKSTYPTIHFNM
jgi:hypothetical protein